MDFTSIKKLTIGEVLENNARKSPDKQAVVFGELSLTYRELSKAAHDLGASLHGLGIRKGDRIAVSLPNWPEFVITYFAIAKLGAIIVPLNTKLSPKELDFILNNAEVSLVIAAGEFDGVNLMGLYDELKPMVPSLIHIVIVGSEPMTGMLSFQELVASGASLPQPGIKVEQEDLFSILYTSGTTGNPKGAMLTHFGLVVNASMTAEQLQCEETDRFLIVVPVFHIFGMSASILACSVSGATMVLMDMYNREEVLKTVEKERITVKHGVPTMFILELNHPNFKQYDMSSLRTGIVSAGPCPVEMVKRIRDEMGCNICISYGMTETSPSLTFTRFDAPDILRAETVGQALEGIQLKIVDDERREVPVGQPGEIACRTPTLMKGYFRNPESTTASMDSEGWFYTGDLATMDEQGYVRIVGRKKEMIIRGGFKVYPREVEEILYTHPAVQEVAVVGLPNPVLGEVNCACLRIKDGHQTTAEEIIDFCKDKLIYYKLPDQVVFLDSLPMTPSGKIKKIDLRELLLA